MHDYVCVDGCCTSYDNIITFNTLQTESDKNTTFNRLSEDLNISMLNVCGISSKLDINVNVTSLNNSGTAELHMMLLIVIL